MDIEARPVGRFGEGVQFEFVAGDAAGGRRVPRHLRHFAHAYGQVGRRLGRRRQRRRPRRPRAHRAVPEQHLDLVVAKAKKNKQTKPDQTQKPPTDGTTSNNTNSLPVDGRIWLKLGK